MDEATQQQNQPNQDTTGDIGFAERNIQTIEGFIEVVTVIPTYTPTKFQQQIKIYTDSLLSPTVRALYIYNYKNNTWDAYPVDTLSGLLTAKGDLLTRTSSALAALSVGSNNQILIADSNQTKGVKWGNGMVTLNTTATEVTINSTTTETDLYSFAVIGNSIGSVGGLYFLITFVLTNNQAANGIVYRLKFGGTTIVSFDSTSNVTISANARTCTLEAWMINSATNAQQWGGRLTIHGTGSQGTLYGTNGATQEVYFATIRNNSAVDTTSNQTFSFTHQASSNSVNLQTTIELASLFKF